MERVRIKPKSSPRRFFILDGHALIHRAYHAQMANLSCECPACDSPTTAKGCPLCNGTGREPTKATYGFTKALLKLCRELRPDYLAFAHDACPRERLLRTKLYPEYKANRPPSEWELSVQMRRIKEIVKALGVCMVHSEGHEADDVIATLVDCSRGLTGVETVIVTRDKDMAQLIGEGVRLYDPFAEEFLDGRWAYQKFGVHPSQVCDWLSMVGDAGDNVKGVPGIGEKGATELLNKFLTVDYFYECMGKGHLPATRAETLLSDNVKAFHLAKRLITLDSDVELEGVDSFEDLVFTGLRLKHASPIFRTLGFKRWE